VDNILLALLNIQHTSACCKVKKWYNQQAADAARFV
jgi:hypothetical protein